MDTKKVQEILKCRFRSNENVEWYSDEYPNYFKELKYNLIYEMTDNIRKMYESGSGSELKERRYKGKILPPKMHAINSSSAMTFNIFGNGDENIGIGMNNHDLPVGTYALEYERKLPVLNPQAPANIDVCLSNISGNNILLFEMKMTEWFNTPSKLRKSYLLDDNQDGKDRVISTLQELLKKYIEGEANSKGEYKSTKNHFDVFQIIKHIWGIYNGIKKGEFVGVDSIDLILGYWTVPDEKFFGDNREQYESYKKIRDNMCHDINEFKNSLEEFRDKFKKETGVEFNFRKLTVKEIIECLSKSPTEETLRRYL